MCVHIREWVEKVHLMTSNLLLMIFLPMGY